MSLPEIQRALMGLNPDNQQRFYKERDEFLNNTPWAEQLPDHLDHFRLFIGSNTNEVTLGITAETYCNLFFTKTFEQYSLGNIMSICQGSESVTLAMYIQSFGHKQGDETLNKWCYMRKAFEVMTSHVNELVEPECAKILKRLITMQASLITHGVKNDKGLYKPGTN